MPVRFNEVAALMIVTGESIQEVIDENAVGFRVHHHLHYLLGLNSLMR